MRYTIIYKIEYNSGVIYTPIGYIDNNPQLVNDINALYESFENWVISNKSDLENGVVNISDFFINSPYVYSANTETDDIDGMGLIEIKNINEM